LVARLAQRGPDAGRNPQRRSVGLRRNRCISQRPDNVRRVCGQLRNSSALALVAVTVPITFNVRVAGQNWNYENSCHYSHRENRTPDRA
jgi:hypothetical protein